MTPEVHTTEAPATTLELVTCGESERALLYVYQGGNHLRTARGRAETLREFAREHYAGAALEEMRL